MLEIILDEKRTFLKFIVGNCSSYAFIEKVLFMIMPILKKKTIFVQKNSSIKGWDSNNGEILSFKFSDWLITNLRLLKWSKERFSYFGLVWFGLLGFMAYQPL